MRVGRTIGAAALAAFAIAAAACSGDNSASETGATGATSTTGTAPAPSGTESPPAETAVPTDSTGEPVETSNDVGELLAVEPGSPFPLDVGTYTAADFDPSLTFTLNDISVANGSLPDELVLTLGPNQNVELAFLGADVEPLRAKAKQSSTELKPDESVASAQDLIGWLRKHPRLTSSKPRSVTIGGVEGSEIDVELKEGEGYRSDLCPAAEPCAVLFHTGPEAAADVAYAAAPGSAIRIATLEVDGRRVVIATEAKGSLDKLAKWADEVLATVTFGT